MSDLEKKYAGASGGVSSAQMELEAMKARMGVSDAPEAAAMDGDAAAQLAAMKAQMDAAEPAASAAPAYQCSQCGWIPEDPSNLPKFCPQCGNVLTDQE